MRLRTGYVMKVIITFMALAAAGFVPAALAAEPVLSAGVAKVDVTPAEPVYMGGYAMRGAPSAGVHEGDRLFTRALVLSDGTNQFAMVMTDIIGLGDHPEYLDRIAAATGIPKEHIVVGDVHNHAAPAPGEKNKGTEWQKRFNDSLAESVQQALASMRPVKIGVGTGKARVAMNRRKPLPDTISPITFDENYASQTFGPYKTDQPVMLHEMEGVIRLGANPLGSIDDEVGVLRIDTLKGKPLAVLVNYACHGTSLGGRNDQVCAEWMGHMLSAIEARASGVQAIFVQGAAGDINPRVVGGLDGYKDCIDTTAALGEEIADEVMRVYEGIQTETPRDPRLRIVSKTLVLPRTYRELFDDFRSTTVDVPTTVVRLGDITWVTFPGELFHEIGQRVKQASQSKITFIAGYANGRIGYFPTQAAFAEGGYETAASHLDPPSEPLYLRQIAGLLQEVR